MQRILEPDRIEAFADRSIRRLRLPDGETLFANRAARLRELAGNATGRAIGDYLQLMATVADAQRAAWAAFKANLPTAEQLELARRHGMPPIHVGHWQRDSHWRAALGQICASLTRSTELPAAAR